MTRRKSIILIIITIAAFIGITALATFAYFATNSRIDANIGVNVETAGASYSFTASSSGDINLPITAVEMSEANISTEKLKTDSGNINVTLASPSNDVLTTCTYDIIWVWDSSDKYTNPDEALPLIQGDKTYPYEFSTKVDSEAEKDLSTLEAGKTANSIILQKSASITSTSTTATSKTHIIEASIYNIPVDQVNLKGKNFKAHITIENVNCTMANSKQMTVNSGNYSGVYDGNGHSISVDVTEPTSGYNIYYSESPLTSENYSSGSTNIPTRANEGTSTIYWCVVADGYTPNCGNNTITINKGTMVAQGTDYTGIADGNNYNISVSVTTPTTGSKIYYSTTTELNSGNYSSGTQTNPTMNTVGETTVYWCAVADNYTPVCSNNKITLALKPKILNVTASKESAERNYSIITISSEGEIIKYSYTLTLKYSGTKNGTFTESPYNLLIGGAQNDEGTLVVVAEDKYGNKSDPYQITLKGGTHFIGWGTMVD